MCVCVCVCVCVPAQHAPKRTSKLHFELQARPNNQIHTKYVKMAGYESIHLNTVYSIQFKFICIALFTIQSLQSALQEIKFLQYTTPNQKKLGQYGKRK